MLNDIDFELREVKFSNKVKNKQAKPNYSKCWEKMKQKQHNRYWR